MTSARTSARTSAAPGSSAPRLRAHGLTLAYGEQPVVEDLDLTLVDGGITAVVGPNGCGSPRCCAPSGACCVRARGRSSSTAARSAGCGPGTWSRDDERHVEQALIWTGMLEHADRPVDELSGGQRQRVWISMALAQGTDVLLLDEPTTFLDLAVEVLDLVDRLHADHGRTVVMVLHDLNLAARYADLLVVMKDGAGRRRGEPAGDPHQRAARRRVRAARGRRRRPGVRRPAGGADRHPARASRPAPWSRRARYACGERPTGTPPRLTELVRTSGRRPACGRGPGG